MRRKKHRLPGAPGEGISYEKLKLERYAILASFTDDADIPVSDLVQQWRTSQQVVVSLISGAKRSTPDGSVAKLLVDAGYNLAGLPRWFGASSQQLVDSVENVVEPAPVPGKVVKTASPSSETPLYTTVEPPLREGDYSPPPRTETGAGTDSARSLTRSTMPPGMGALSPEQVQLLAQRGVHYDEVHHTWVKMTPQGRGVYVETVNPQEVLRQIQADLQKSSLFDNLADDMLDSVKINTQAILKKVALNPSVFQCFQYVSNVRDPKSKKVLFGGDFGDYISYCVLFTTRTMFGVEPSFITDLPSIYKMQQEKQSQESVQATPQLGYLNPVNNPQQGFRVGATSLPYSYRDLGEE